MHSFVILENNDMKKHKHGVHYTEIQYYPYLSEINSLLMLQITKVALYRNQ